MINNMHFGEKTVSRLYFGSALFWEAPEEIFAGDEHWDNVVGMYRYDGSNIVDLSPFGGSLVTNTGLSVDNSVESPTDTPVLRLNANSKAIFTTTNLGLEDFTIEMWFRCDASDSRWARVWATKDSVTIGDGHYNAQLRDTTGISVFAETQEVSERSEDLKNKFSHLAFCKQGDNFYTAIDGVVSVEAYTPINDVNGVFVLGQGSTSSIPLWFNEIRITKGVARYVDSFDPYADNVVSLLHFDGVSGDTSITDEMSNTWQVFGNASLQSNNPRFGETSLMVDGLGSYIQTDSGLPETADFTVEAWVCLSESKTETTIFSQLHPSGTAVNGRINLDVKNGYINTFFGGTGYYGESSTDLAPPIDSYFHVAFCRSGSDFYVALNGQVRLVFSDPNPLASVPFRVGRASNLLGHEVRDLNGYVDELRITKGVARYTENFTPPTEPFPF